MAMTNYDSGDGVGYRADIDGLRAVAIVAVVLYHAGFAPFGGGFIGVDVFFVISGYLITSLIAEQIDRGEFSLCNFYLRRIRRIFPALFLMVAFCAVIGWLLLTPHDYDLLGQSIAATVLFSSNILFWRQTGYFDTPLEDWPLLHTWSLGVEEQFYIAFPVFLVLVCRFFSGKRIAITLALCTLSFGLNVLTVKDHPNAAFYLAPTRIWELLVGALLAMGTLRPPRSARWGGAASALGVVLIGWAIFGFSDDTNFLGFAALAPTSGTAAVIWGGTGQYGRMTRLLSHRAPVLIGKISYSWYLWHFPLLAFGAYVFVEGPSLMARITLIALSIVFAVGSWLYVEQPVRQGRWIFRNAKMVFGTAAAALALFGGFGIAARFAEGFPDRIGKHSVEILASVGDVNADRERCVILDPADLARRPLCKFGIDGATSQFALWGDSHAESLRGAVDSAAKKSSASRRISGRFRVRAATGHRAPGPPGMPPGERRYRC